MAHPKRQHSKQRTRNRRSQWKLAAPSLGPCTSCGKPILSHRVCPFCGQYKGQQVVAVKAKKAEASE